ncbi:hypothetical protein V9T40_001331 [Parthenolecanium corni]|uniref:EF-hand domain-containing protein n=1 Tax=Parthenolecanium corni TaxID=536013 RepID=A0AAN9TP19_9HEMI
MVPHFSPLFVLLLPFNGMLSYQIVELRPDPNFFRRLLQKDGRDKIKTRRMSSIPHPEVFLGGSCNPTTWRQDEAIPILRNSGVTFFNPQVSDWSPELIELEHEAKENSQILLYVLDSKTRNVVSLVETAYFLGKKRKIIIVLNLFQEAGHEIAGEKITCNEFNDLNSSSCLLKQLMERQKVAVFSNVREALRYANEVLKERSKETDEKTKMREAFESLDVEKCGQISPNDVSEAIRLFMQKRNQSDELQKNILQKIDNYRKVNHKTGKVDFEQFCQIVSKLNLNSDVKSYSNGHVEKRNNFTPDLFRSLSTPDDRPTFVARNGISVSDIYLGGDCDHHEDWRQKIAIPGIKNACLTFYNPENERQVNKKLSQSEFAAINNAHVKLFVITSTSRSLFPMVLASYFIGIGANVVLCIQYLPDKCVIGSDELSHTAVKDYNRGRHYLADIARRENVPIFESISDAVQTAINKCIR